MMRLALLALLATTSACGSTTEREPVGPRFENKPEKYSIEQPKDWAKSIDQGSTRFSQPNGKHTIVVRSDKRPSQITEGKAVSNDAIVESTKRVLAALPGAKIEGERSIHGEFLDGFEFSLTYRPLSGHGTPYHRTHTLLFGKQQLFHVMATAPVAEWNAGLTKDVALTLQEEI